MKKLFILCFGLLTGLCSLAQESILMEEWKYRAKGRDTILLGKWDSMEESEVYLERHDEYCDTSYYLDFRQKDSLRIKRVIRSNKILSKESASPQKEQPRKDNLTQFENAAMNINARERKLSLYDWEKGTWIFQDWIVEIRQTKLWNGRYRMSLENTSCIKLVRIY